LKVRAGVHSVLHLDPATIQTRPIAIVHFHPKYIYVPNSTAGGNFIKKFKYTKSWLVFPCLKQLSFRIFEFCEIATDHDLAIVKTFDPFQMTNYVQVIQLTTVRPKGKLIRFVIENNVT